MENEKEFIQNTENNVSKEQYEKRKSIIDKLNFVKRNFLRKIDKGSLRGSVISWIRMTLGVGVLALPFCFSQFGILVGTILVTVAVLYSFISYKFILEINEECQKNDIFKICKHYLGKRYSELYRVTLLLDICANYILYPLINYGIFEKLTANIISYRRDQDGEILKYNGFNFMIRGLFGICLFSISIFLLLKRRIDNMNFISTLFLVNIVYFIFIILIETGVFIEKHKGDPAFKYNIVSVKPNFDIISSFCSILLSFYIQPFVFTIKNELLNPTKKRIFKVCKSSLGLEYIIFLVIGIFGYMSMGKSTPDLIILREAYDGKNDIFMKIGLYIFIIINTIGIPIYNPSLRDLIMKSYKIKDNKKNYVLVSLLPYFFSLVVAVSFPDIIKIFGLFGGIFCNVNGFFTIFLIKILIMYRKGETKCKTYYLAVVCFFFSIFLAISYLLFLIIPYLL